MMQVLFAAIAALAACVRSGVAAPGLDEGFRSPPMDARPQTWWHWMNGNVTSGIRV